MTEEENVSQEEISKFDKFRKRCVCNGETIKEALINKSVHVVNSKFAKDPTYQIVSINNLEDVKCRIYENNSYSKKYDSVYIQTLLSCPLSVGDLIYYDDSYWLCTYARLENGVYYQGTIVKCNYELKWIKDGKIHSSYCFVDNNSLSVDDDKLVNHPDGSIIAQLPITPTTTEIVENMRFLIDIQRENPNTYKVTSCNFVTRGIGYITLERDIFNSITDNLELMITDYYNQELVEDSIEFDGKDIIELVPKVKIIADTLCAKIGTTKTIQAEFTDAEDDTAVWTVVSDVNIPYIETPDGLVFEVPYDLSLIGNSIGVTVTNTAKQCADSIILKIRGVV